MKIESGTTGERPTRILIFLVMSVTFAGWFGYDGFVGYAKKNLEWAGQLLPDRPEGLETNPNMVMAVQDRLKEGMTVEQVTAILGRPALEQKRELVFVGREIVARVGVEDGKVVSVIRDEVNPNSKPDKLNLILRPGNIDDIKPGMTEEELIEKFTEPTEVNNRKLWFVGPAAYAGLEIVDGKLDKFEFHESTKRTENDIVWQKRIAAILAVVSVIVLVRLFQALMLRVVVDEAGLVFNRKRIAWNEMTDLDTGEYRDKGWVDLHYRRGDSTLSMRLDSYHIKKFDEIVEAVAQKKDFIFQQGRQKEEQISDE